MVRETSSSSVARMRGPASNSITREPSSAKTDATWAPVAPAPITSSDSGTAVSAHASRCETDQLRARHRQGPVGAARTEDELVRVQAGAVLGLDRVGVDEPRGPGVFAQDHTGVLSSVAQDGVLGHLGDHLAYPREQPAVVQGGVARLDAVPVQVPRLTAQPGRLRQRAHRNGAVRGGHPAHRIPGDQGCSGAQLGRSQRGEDAGRPGADDARRRHVPQSS